MLRPRTKLLILSGLIVLCAVSWAVSQNWQWIMTLWSKPVLVALKEQPEGRRDQPVFAIWDKGAEKYGFINRFNEVLIPHQYEYAGDFDEGVARVKQDGTLKFINEKGDVIGSAPARAAQAEELSEGMIWYAPKGILGFSMRPYKWGLLQVDGKVVLTPSYPEVKKFSGGLAAVNVGAKWEYGFWTGGKWGYVNKKGEMVIPTQYDHAWDFSEGLANVHDAQGSRFIDTRGAVVIGGLGGYAGNFREGLCPVRIGSSRQQTRYINKKGETQFTVDGWGEEFHEGLAVIKLSAGPNTEALLHGFIDKTGKIVIKPKYAEAFDFSDGLAAVRDEKTEVYGMGNRWGFIDKTGTLRIGMEYNEVHPFKNELTRVHIGGEMQHVSHQRPYWKNGEWWIMDISGRKLHRCYDWEKPRFP